MVLERRRYQRIPVQVSALITNEDGVCIKVVVYEVSTDGLGIVCDTRERNMITPGGSFIRDGRPVSVVVDLNLLDEDNQLSNIVARCHVIFSRRISSNQCKIGLNYTEFENSGHERLIRFIEKTLESK